MPQDINGARQFTPYTGTPPDGSYRSGGRLWDANGNELVSIYGSSGGSGVDQTARDAASAAQTTATAKYTKPGTGIPLTDLAAAVVAKLLPDGGSAGDIVRRASGSGYELATPTTPAPSDIGAIAAALVDARGDLLVATADNTVARRGVGTDGQVLTADSTDATGVKWATPAAGGGSGGNPYGSEQVETWSSAHMGSYAAQVWANTNAARHVQVLNPGSVSKVGLHVVVSSGNISIAVYNGTGTGRQRKPGTFKATTGAIACPAVGYQEVALPSTVTVAIGDFISLSCDNGTASFMGVSGTATPLLSGRVWGKFSGAHPLAASPTLTAGAVGATSGDDGGYRCPGLIGVA